MGGLTDSDPCLAHDAPAMRLDGFLAYPQRMGNLLIQLTLDDQGHDLKLSRGEACEP